MTLTKAWERANIPIYPWYIADLTATHHIKKISKYCVEEAFMIIDDSYFTGYYELDSADKLGEEIFERMLKNHSFLEKTITNIYKKAEILMDFCKKIDQIKDINKLSNKELVKLYEDYTEKLIDMRTWGWIPVFMDGLKVNYLTDYFLNSLKNFLAKKHLENKTTEYYSILTSADKPSEVQTEEISRLEILLKILNNKGSKKILDYIKNNEIKKLQKNYSKIYSLLENHRKRFEWLTYAYAGPIMSMEYLFDLLNDNLSKKESIQKQFNLIKEHYKNIKKQKQEIIKKLKLNKELKYLAKVSSELMFVKDWRKGIYQKSYVSMDKVLEEIAKRLDITPKEVRFIVLDEVKEALLQNKKELYKKKLKQRIKKCCYYVTKGKIKVYEGLECEKKIEEIKKRALDHSAKQEQVTELKGTVAYRGKVKGIAKIVQVVADIKKVNEGDILISSATNPDLIAAMKKASAFVTDLGGITTHAAIVSREMKKPCVVGTRIASQVLKDGDLIEVDADKGIVKIIKKKMNKKIKGIAINKGTVKGNVKLIDQNTKLSEIPKGKIIVAETIEPKMTPFLKNSLAIITDEGSITCHAAKTAREFDIIAIVGTKIATKVLKNGDLVEVDANKGIVKILK